jgi:azurin
MFHSRRALLKTAVALSYACVGTSADAAEAVRLEISSDGDELVYRPASLSCASGEQVTLVFHHTGKIIHDAHNWVLLKPGMLKPFLALAIGVEDPSIAILPDAEAMVLAVSPFCALGQTVQFGFMAPAPGDYPFVCSVPGHGETMNGVLHVSA